jgi:signal transduction histidine kinase
MLVGVHIPPQRLWLVACLVAAALVVTRAALQPFSGAPWHTIACDIVGLLRALFSFAALAWAARVQRGRSLPWWLLAAGAAAWCVADAIWLILAVLGTQPWGSAADIFFLLFYPLALAGALALPRQQPRAGGAWAIVLDIGVIVTASAAAMWVLLINPTMAASPAAASVFSQVIALAYPVGDLLLLWLALDLLFRGQVRTAAGISVLLACGAATLIATDLVYAVQVLHGTYVRGNSLGILWSLGLVLIGMAGARQATVVTKPPVVTHMPRMASAVLAAVALITTWALLVANPADPVARVAAGFSVVLVLLRQLHALASNRRLEADLQRINSELEERVRERSSQLAQAQQRLAEAERLEAVGRVAGAVAHDFNNILTAVSGHTELARQRSVEPVVHEHLDQVLQAVQRAVDLGRRLVATSRPAEARRQVIDLVPIASEVAGQLGAAMPQGVEMAVIAPSGPVLVLADGTQLHQVLMNLCVNARDAMPAGGRLSITIAPLTGWVEMSVSDTGMGMTESVRARLFEPYFTTKADGRGNGLGLATVHAIVRQHGGSIEVETSPGRGSVFRVRLPAG